MSANQRPFISENDVDELVDEKELEEIGLTIKAPPEARRSGPKRAFYRYTPERVDALLVQAGYEPTDIPQSLRLTALSVAWAWAGSLGDDEDIARACGRSVRTVRNAIRALNIAGPPRKPT